MLSNNLRSFSNCLKIAHFNTGSFAFSDGNYKIDELRSLLCGNHVDVFGVTETWNKSYVSNASFSINGYKVFRHDRPNRRGGGICIYLRKEFRAKVILKSVNSQIEFLLIRAIIGSITVVFGVIYRPPDVPHIENIPDEFLNEIARYRNVIIMGDFNHDLAKTNISREINIFWNALGLTISHTNHYTHFDTRLNTESLIDYFITNSNSIKYQNQFWLPGISKHAFIYMAVDLLYNQCEQPIEFFDFNAIDLNLLSNLGPDWDFSSIYSSNNTNYMVEQFNAILSEKFVTFVPKRIFEPATASLNRHLNSSELIRIRVS